MLVDSSSGWLEAASCSSRHSNNVISFRRTIFARFGVPDTVVTDNAPEFTGQEMHSPEYRPQSNGQTERMVRVLKDGLKCFDPGKSSLQSFMQRLLFVHRSTAMRVASLLLRF